MDIDGLGENLVEQFISNGLIENIADIYTLTFDDIASLKKNGTKFATNLINAIQESKTRPLFKLITALGIRHIGTKSAKTLAKHFKTMDNLQNASVDELVSR
jgi:DNA ligase (NAD+)